MVERQTRAKRGEPDYKNPWGGIPGDNRFSVSLRILMVKSGFSTQKAWAEELGMKPRLMSEWIIGKSIPTKEQMETILASVEDKDHLHSDLTEAWKEQVVVRGPRAHMIGRKIKVEPKTPVGEWIRAYSENHKVSLRRLSTIFGFTNASINIYDKLSVESMADIIHQSQSELCASQTEVEELCEAVAQTIEDKVKRGRYSSRSTYFKRFRHGV